MKTFYFNTGVKAGIPSNEAHIPNAKPVQLSDGQVWLNGTKQIPFDCEDVPETASFAFCAPKSDLYPEGTYIVRKMHNTTMLSEYAYFTK